MITIVNNPATNPKSAKAMAVIFIAFSPAMKKDVRVSEIPSSWSCFTSSAL
jgi:hypothetical protein